MTLVPRTFLALGTPLRTATQNGQLSQQRVRAVWPVASPGGRLRCRYTATRTELVRRCRLRSTAWDRRSKLAAGAAEVAVAVEVVPPHKCWSADRIRFRNRIRPRYSRRGKPLSRMRRVRTPPRRQLPNDELRPPSQASLGSSPTPCLDPNLRPARAPLHRIEPKALQLPRWSRGEASASCTRPCRRRAARQVGVRARRANNC